MIINKKLKESIIEGREQEIKSFNTKMDTIRHKGENIIRSKKRYTDHEMMKVIEKCYKEIEDGLIESVGKIDDAIRNTINGRG